MTAALLPLAYRWFLAKGLTDWMPWYFLDSAESIGRAPDFSKNGFAQRAFKAEFGTQCEVYPFARRQDRDCFAFFVVHNSVVQDNVISCHLSFSGTKEVTAPLTYSVLEENPENFMHWIRSVVLRDVEEWISEEDLQREPHTA